MHRANNFKKTRSMSNKKTLNSTYKKQITINNQ